MGDPLSLADEYRLYGILPMRANHDRAAGYARLLELLHPDDERPFPSWHPRRGEKGSPRLFVFPSCKHLISQFKSAPIAEDGRDAGEAYDAKWANAHGHALDSARYFAMTRPSPSQEPPRPLDDPRAEYLRQRLLRRRKPRELTYIEFP
jgi:hypothetical protein